MTTRPAAPLPDAAVERALLPFGRSRMLPAEAYVSAEVLAWELRHFFAGSWACAGRLDELAAGGVTQRGLRVGDVPVLLTFDAAGGAGGGPPVLRAFADTCRHRAHELLGAGACGSRSSVVCPYHAWTYRLDGSLQAAPGLRDGDGFRAAEHGLVPLPAEVWHGWVLVDATGGAAPLPDHLGALDGLVAPYRPERLVPAAAHTYDVAANWKVVCENYHECYHCPLIHPELCRVSPPASGDNYGLPGAWVGGSMRLRDGARTMSFDGQGSAPPLPGAPAGEVRYLGLLPNLLLSLHPDYVMTHRLTPLGPAATRVECAWYFAPEAVADPGFDPSYAVGFWDLTNRQDWAACESVQRGLASPHYVPGPLAPNEDAVHRFVTKIARGYRGVPFHAG